MKKLLNNLSPYHRTVVAIYVVALLFTIFLFPEILHYEFSFNNIGIAISIFIITLVIFLAGLFWKEGILRIPKDITSLCIAFVYSTLFAIPEEILFRGIIQNFFQAHLDSFLAILISSLIFGLAHLLNGARSFHPGDWSWQFSSLAFLAGLPLGMLYWLTGNLLMPTLLHLVLVVVLQLIPPDKGLRSGV